ncbi:MAG: S-adenosylmethionine:tRNA ribosyltransferase-isomerase [Myxococcales bacterium]|nr:S-adenosylmethionine:tRNA ribosyltransferase-isomerase [Myxococcales bacterium]
MAPATWPRDDPRDGRLIRIDRRSNALRHGRVRDLADVLVPGDLLVVNDAATIPASLHAADARGRAVEVRLAGEIGQGRFRAVLLGDGDWRTRTEHRRPPPVLAPGATLVFASDLAARVESVDPAHPRLVVLSFSARGTALWSALYRRGRPVQYAHLAGPLEVWHAQTPFSARPWAVEAPSAGRALTWELVLLLRRRGIELAALTHAAGLSSTGDASLDASLPFPERYDLPEATVGAVARARTSGGRVVAVGTSVVRALEGCATAHRGELVAGEGITDLRIDAAFRPQIADGIVSGLHEIGSSHRELLRAFAPEALLSRALDEAAARGYLGHEFGDACLVLPGAA